MNEKQMKLLVRSLELDVQARGGMISRSVLRLYTEQFQRRIENSGDAAPYLPFSNLTKP